MIREREKAGVWDTWDCNGGDWPDYERPFMLLSKVEAVFCREYGAVEDLCIISP